jgi:hypothetical protein
MAEQQNPPRPDDADPDPNRDRDKPQFPAPPGAGESGKSPLPEGAPGAPPPGVTPAGTPTPAK